MPSEAAILPLVLAFLILVRLVNSSVSCKRPPTPTPMPAPALPSAGTQSNNVTNHLSHTGCHFLFWMRMGASPTWRSEVCEWPRAGHFHIRHVDSRTAPLQPRMPVRARSAQLTAWSWGGPLTSGGSREPLSRPRPWDQLIPLISLCVFI